jgi:hypothetical protein
MAAFFYQYVAPMELFFLSSDLQGLPFFDDYWLNSARHVPLVKLPLTTTAA